MARTKQRAPETVLDELSAIAQRLSEPLTQDERAELFDRRAGLFAEGLTMGVGKALLGRTGGCLSANPSADVNAALKNRGLL